MKPIIDVHAHVFNARDIPLKGYLLSRKYNKWIQWLFYLIIPGAARCVRRKLNPDKKKSIFFNLLCKVMHAIIYTFMGKHYSGWADTMAKKIPQIMCEMIETYQKDGIELYVPLMIDYEYWFKNTVDNPMVDQIDYLYKNVVLPYRGMIHPFVPFDPARELAYRKKMCNPDGFLETHGSMNLVKDAIENKGFIGVKLYNAMGYKPFNNAAVDENRKKITMHKKKYVFKGEEYDEVLAELYQYCVDNEVPITAHCGMYGSESYPNASFDFGHADFWQEVLDQDRFKTLRLNLAHFGWNPDQGYHGDKTWVQNICEMFKKYEHLYADVSHHRVVLKKYFKKIQSDYDDMINEYPIVKERLLFGIDWHVIKRLKHYATFKDKYVELLSHDDLFSKEEVENFLGGNSLRFLGLLPGGKSRKRLKKFYKNHDIDLPKWLIV